MKKPQALMCMIISKLADNPDAQNINKILRNNAAAFKALGFDKQPDHMYNKLSARIDVWRGLDPVQPEHPEDFNPIISDKQVAVVLLLSKEDVKRNFIGDYYFVEDAKGNKVLAVKRKNSYYEAKPFVVETLLRGDFGPQYTAVEDYDNFETELEALKAADTESERSWIFSEISQTALVTMEDSKPQARRDYCF
jgi:hypothetical protein